VPLAKAWSVFTIEDGGNIHLYSVVADGSAEPELVVGGDSSEADASAEGAPGQRPGRREKGGASTKGRLWQVADDGKLKPIEVQIGISDGVVTEITGGDVKEGDEFASGELKPGAAAATGEVNPFGPPRFGGRRR